MLFPPEWSQHKKRLLSDPYNSLTSDIVPGVQTAALKIVKIGKIVRLDLTRKLNQLR